MWLLAKFIRSNPANTSPSAFLGLPQNFIPVLSKGQFSTRGPSKLPIARSAFLRISAVFWNGKVGSFLWLICQLTSRLSPTSPTKARVIFLGAVLVGSVVGEKLVASCLHFSFKMLPNRKKSVMTKAAKSERRNTLDPTFLINQFYQFGFLV